MTLKNILFFVVFIVFHANAQTDSVDQSGAIEPASTFKNTAAKDTHAGSVYRVRNAIDIPVTLALGGSSVYLLTVVYSKDPTPDATILNLNKNNVPSIDRWTAGWHDANLDKISYIPFYAVMPLPLLLLADKQIAGDKGTVGLMYLEAFACEGILYTSSVHFIERFRPDTYDTDLPMNYRTNGNRRNSFFAGHVAVTALSTLFISKVYDDYHPESNFKWVLYGASAATTLGMAWLRLNAGQHFTSDILVGMAVGTVCGLGIPIIHRNRQDKEQKWSLTPDVFDKKVGIAFSYKL